MTDRFKEALFRVTEWVEDAFNGNPVIMEMLEKDESTLLEAITLATESEQLRKERDDLAVLCADLISKQIKLAKKVKENGNA